MSEVDLERAESRLEAAERLFLEVSDLHSFLLDLTSHLFMLIYYYLMNLALLHVP